MLDLNDSPSMMGRPSGEEHRFSALNPLLFFLHAAFESLRLEVICQPSVNVSPRLNVEPVSVVVGKLPNEREEGVVELGRESRTLT